MARLIDGAATQIAAAMGAGLEEIGPGYVAVGRVIGAWGVRGELRVEPLAPGPALARGRIVKIGGRDHYIESSHRSARFLRLKLREIGSREEAQGLRGAYLQALERDLEALPEGEYYRFQLIGLVVRSVDGRKLGRITDILSAPENDIYVLEGPFGEVLIPAVDDVVRNVDLAGGVVTIEIIPGLLP